MKDQGFISFDDAQEGHVREAERAFARVRALDRDRSRIGQMLRMQARLLAACHVKMHCPSLPGAAQSHQA